MQQNWYFTGMQISTSHPWRCSLMQFSCQIVFDWYSDVDSVARVQLDLPCSRVSKCLRKSKRCRRSGVVRWVVAASDFILWLHEHLSSLQTHDAELKNGIRLDIKFQATQCQEITQTISTALGKSSLLTRISFSYASENLPFKTASTVAVIVSRSTMDLTSPVLW